MAVKYDPEPFDENIPVGITNIMIRCSNPLDGAITSYDLIGNEAA